VPEPNRNRVARQHAGKQLFPDLPEPYPVVLPVFCRPDYFLLFIMLQADHHQKGLFKIAAITSVGWGIISVFPVVNAGRPFFLPPRPPRNLPPPNMPPPHAVANLTVSMVAISLLMFSLWAMNIVLYQKLQRSDLPGKTQKILRYVLSYAATTLIYYACLFLLYLILESGRPMFFPLIVALTNNTIILFLMDLIILQRTKAQMEVEYTQLKMNNAIAQHQHLKHQLHPHFLFNSLNTLKSLIKRNSGDAEDYLIRLSDLLRASISGARPDTIPLKEELKLCVDYLEMQQVRFKEAFHYTISVPDQLLETGLVPLFSLQLLVENAIKHNAFTREEPLFIKIFYNQDYISVWNNKKLKRHQSPSPGTGLKNLSERYKVIAGQNINIVDSEGFFCVELLILFK
jgi:two-component system LytT family sensor kinase